MACCGEVVVCYRPPLRDIGVKIFFHTPSVLQETFWKYIELFCLPVYGKQMYCLGRIWHDLALGTWGVIGLAVCQVTFVWNCHRG